MKTAGISIIALSVLAILIGLIMAFSGPAQPTQLERSRLVIAEADLHLCEIDRRLGEAGSCAAEQRAVTDAQPPGKDPAVTLWGYVLLSAAPFFILIGTILAAAGQVEAAVRAQSRAGTA